MSRYQLALRRLDLPCIPNRTSGAGFPESQSHKQSASSHSPATPWSTPAGDRLQQAPTLPAFRQVRWLTVIFFACARHGKQRRKKIYLLKIIIRFFDFSSNHYFKTFSQMILVNLSAYPTCFPSTKIRNPFPRW